MKHLVLVAICAIAWMGVYGQTPAPLKIADIPGYYCELVIVSKPFSFNSKVYGVVYAESKMGKLLQPDGKDMFSEMGNAVVFLNAFYENGWELVTIYEDYRGDKVKVFLMHKKK